MRIITPEQFFATADVKPETFRADVSKNQAAFAFGTGQPLAAGRFIDLDPIAWRLVNELRPGFGRVGAATLVKAFCDGWLYAVSLADRTAEPVFFAITESGPPSSVWKGGAREHVNAGAVTLSALAKQKPKATGDVGPDRITLINISKIMRDVRERAANIGLDLTEPFCPPFDDPSFNKELKEIENWREAMGARVRRAELQLAPK